jgi:MYXO-CTERM domain-containing protein
VRRGSAIGGFALAVLSAAPALAARPVLTGEATFGRPGGEVLVHYATSGTDAALVTDVNSDGVPDFVAEVADTAELALDHFIALGFRRPLDDGALGGDRRIDIYLRDLTSADGNAGVDSCSDGHCVGYVVAENDFAGYSYSSITEGIRSVVPHELFHLVQNAYASPQPTSWTEGSAVWAVENLYGAGNSDFERFLPSFLPKTYRPFERPVTGFGDSYPYGASLWPYFLEHRFSADVVVESWAASEHATFLDAVDAALTPVGSSVDAAWTEMTRWNAFTGSRGALGPYQTTDGSAAPATWPEVLREPAIAGTGTVYVEGLSARYVPLTVASRSRLVLTPDKGIRIAGWLVADGRGFTEGTELDPDGAALAATIDAGSYTLVVTGLARGTIATAVAVALEPPDDGGGGCAVGSASASPLALIALAAAMARRRRRIR